MPVVFHRSDKSCKIVQRLADIIKSRSGKSCKASRYFAKVARPYKLQKVGYFRKTLYFFRKADQCCTKSVIL